MFKLVAVGGKLRGEEFQLNEGDNVIGRDGSCDVVIGINGISKRHLSMTVKGDNPVYIKDLGSSNGTFVNGKLVKSAALNNGDKITLPDVILQLVYVREEKIIVKKYKEEEEDELDDLLEGGVVPDNIISKIKYYFKYKIMKPIYGLNEEFELRVLIGIVLFVFVILTITLTIFPILNTSRSLLEYETAQRGAQYAQEIARLNSRAMEANKLDQINTSFMNDANGVQSYELFDLQGRIVRPIKNENKFVSDPFSVKAMNWANSSGPGDNFIIERLGDGILGIAHKMIAFNRRMNSPQTVGVIAIKFAPRSLQIEAKKNSGAYLEALSTSALVAIVFFGIFYYLTVRHLDELMVQMEECMRGKRKELESSLLWEELNPLRNIINSLLSRNRELTSEGGDDSFSEMEPEGPYLDTCAELIRGAGVPAIVLDSEKNVYKINMNGEDLTGIREADAVGMSLMDVCREKGIAATLIEVSDNSANSNGTTEETNYEIQGTDYDIYCKAFIGKDSFPKAYYLTFVIDD